jgi:oxalate decarboxylase
VIEGRCRVTTIDPQNQCEIVEFGPGDVWYFPRGHGHSIQGLGPGTCVFVLV